MGYGRVHLRAIREVDAAQLVGVVDPQPLSGEPAELAGGAAHYPSLRALLDAVTPDIVTIATPIPSHLALAEEAMRAGCDVLLEKPPAATMAQYERLLAVAEETGRACQVGFQADGSSAYEEISAALASGEIGDLRGVGAVGTWVRPDSYYARAAWAGRRRLDDVDVVDGVITNPLAHAVHAALRLAGARQAAEVGAIELEIFRAHDIEADDTSALRVMTTSNIPVALGLTLCAAEASEPRLIVHGTSGRITYWYKTDRIELRSSRGTRTWQATTGGLLENLVEHVRDREVPLLSPLSHCGAFMRVLEAVRTAPDPAPIAEEHLSRHESDGERYVVVREVEHWCEKVAEELRTFTTLGAPWAPSHQTLAGLAVQGSVVARYVDGAGTSALDSPRPHLHPVRTLAGVIVSDAAPADHTWHAGVGMAVQDLGGHNLWGGRTYLPGRGYTWRADHGRVHHEDWLAGPPEPGEAGPGSVTGRLSWRGQDGSLLMTERRNLTWRAATTAPGWELHWHSELTNATDAPLTLGSPGSHGREGGGYGGFFWRMPPCTGIAVRTPQGQGEDAVHGKPAPWLAWSATAADGRDFTVVFTAEGHAAPDPWFVRVADYPGVGSSLAWTTPVVLAPGETTGRAFRCLVADGRLSDADAAASAR